MKETLAQGLIINPEPIGGSPIPTVYVEGPLKNITNIGDIINILIAFLLPISGIILLFILIWGGYDIMMSQGDPEKVKSGQGKVTSGIFGFILLGLAFLLTQIVAYILGLDFGLFS